jgi:hypothetical protein
MLCALVMAGLAVIIEGDTTCPSAARVSDAVVSLLTGLEARTEPHRVRLAERDGGVEVVLSSGPARVLQTRTFPRGSSCEDLAAAIAVVIATWEVELSGAVSVEVESSRIATFAGAPSVVVPTAPRTTLGVGLAALGSLDREGAVAGMLGEAVVARGPWALRLAAMTAMRRHTDLAPGSVHWRRSALALGVHRRILRSRRWAIEAGADAVLGMVAASGDGFTEDRSSFSAAPGIAPRVRATLHDGRLGWFLEVSDWIWLRRGQLGVTGLNGSADLPRHEVRGALGIRIELGDR